MKLGIIGAGECFRDKMLPALHAMGNFSVAWIVDKRPEAEQRTYLAESGFTSSFQYYRTNGFLTETPPGEVDIVIDATPSRYRASNIALALKAGKNVYAEKPFAISQIDIAIVEEAVKRNPDKIAYFAEYYWCEKGLIFRTLTGEIKVGDWYDKNFIRPCVDSRLAQVLDSIGNIKSIDGTCLEGVGKKSGLSHRFWVLDPVEGGGQLLDMSTHLFTFLPSLENRLGNISILETVTGVCIEALQEYKKAKRGNVPIAETYAEVKLRAESGCDISFAFGKYTGVEERHFTIQAENGHINIDFETQEMEVASPVLKGKFTTLSNPKYAVIMQDLKRRLELGQKGPHNLDVCRRTLEMLLEAKSKVDKTFLHKAGDLQNRDYTSI